MFLVSLERSWTVDIENGLALAIWTSAAQVMGKRRAGSQTAESKSRESTSSRPPNCECDTSLERSRRGLQVWFRPRCDQTSQSGVMSSQSPGTPPGTVSGLQPGSLPSPGRGVFRGPKCPWQVPTPKGVPNAKLTSCGWFLDADSSLIY